ncbi:MAG: hypothetical protein H7Z16_02245 [Pyrinomonadaceae bacterium]|nr:hypothetical protein [Pyrinomonadaceae bacterium]
MENAAVSCPCALSSLLVLIILACCSHGAIAQSAPADSQGTPVEAIEVAVPIIDKVDSGHIGSGYCGSHSDDASPVVNEDVFRKLIAPDSRNSSRSAKDRCAFLKRLKVDFSKHSLLNYRVNGDCFIRATAKVTRNEIVKKYTLWITRIYGGCRAAGTFEGWLVVDKLLPDYDVEAVVSERDEWAPRELLKP